MKDKEPPLPSEYKTAAVVELSELKNAVEEPLVTTVLIQILPSGDSDAWDKDINPVELWIWVWGTIADRDSDVEVFVEPARAILEAAEIESVLTEVEESKEVITGKDVVFKKAIELSAKS